MAEPLHRGTTEGANCEACPFATAGRPTNPVVSEYPDDPMWLVLGEGPGWNETKTGRPFVGASGSVLNQVLKKIGRPREHVFVGNATACTPPQGTPVEIRERAAECCKPRLLAELQQFPGKPILTLGAVAARSVIPKETLDAIDPPDVPKTRKKRQKEKQRADRKAERKLKAAIEKVAVQRFRKMEKKWRGDLIHEAKRRTGKKPAPNYFELPEYVKQRNLMWKKALADAPLAYQQKVEARALAKKHAGKKSKKKKPIKITDIVGTLFDVDVDGSGVRPVIPAIHPAALLRGGGATIGGSHTPDMAYVNLVYDAAKIDALARGRDIRLKFGFEYEVFDSERAELLFINELQKALDEGVYALDLETYVDDPDRHHALMTYVAKIRVIGIATVDRAVSVGWDLLSPFAQSYFQLAIARVSGRFHNGIYDRAVLRAYGFNIPVYGLDEDAPGYEDSLLAHHAAFPGNSHNLQSVTSQLYGVGAWKAQFRNQDETLDKLAIYNAKDTYSTYANVEPLLGWVKKTETEIVYHRDRRMSEIAGRMHINGQPVSRDVNQQLVTTFTRLARDARAKVEAQAADPKTLDAIKHKLALMLASKKRKRDAVELSLVQQMQLEAGQPYEEFEELYRIRKRDLDDENWYWKINNSKHIAALLQAIDAPLTQMTEGGTISTKREILEAMVDIPIVRDILEYRENEKMLDFVGPIFDRVARDGSVLSYGFADPFDRIHPIWSIHKISGRWAGSEPMGTSNPPREKTKKVAFGTTLPSDIIVTNYICECGKYRDDKHEGHEYRCKQIEYAVRPTTKRQIVAPNGRVIVGFDFAQVEARVIALVSGDEFMCDVFGRDGDLHTECAIEVFPGFITKTPSERKMMRTVCKSLEYATWYGAADEKVWKGLLKEGYTNLKLTDVVGSLNRLRRKMSGVIRWQRETIHGAAQPPYQLRDLVAGRRRVWPMGNVEASEALNSVPQFTAAAIMNEGMDKFDQWLYERRFRFKNAFAISQIHDAAYFECDADDAEPISQGIIECFSTEKTNPKNGKTVKFPVEVGFGESMHEV